MKKEQYFLSITVNLDLAMSELFRIKRIKQQCCKEMRCNDLRLFCPNVGNFDACIIRNNSFTAQVTGGKKISSFRAILHEYQRSTV